MAQFLHVWAFRIFRGKTLKIQNNLKRKSSEQMLKVSAFLYLLIISSELQNFTKI